MSPPLRILCLENDFADVELLRDTLETEGIACTLTQVEAECDFRAALEQGGFDLILADYTLPSFDGLSALRMVRQQLPDVPFIFVSGTLGEEVAIEALKTGATDYVFKTRLSRLAPAIHRAMHEAGARAELRRSDEALKRSETYLAEAQRLTHTGSYAYDGTTETFTYWSEELFRIWGFDPQQGPPDGNSLLQRIHPEDRERVQERLGKSLREQSDYTAEYRIVLSDGTTKHIEAIGHHVSTGPGGLMELIGTHVDITQRKKAEEALRESETRFRTFVDHAADAFFVLDFEEGTIVDVNRSACDGLGFTRQELIGMSPLAFGVDLDRAALESTAQRAAAGEAVLLDRHWHRRKDGSVFPVEVSTSVLWHGGHRFLLRVARDISDRVRAEEQREKLRVLEADLAHMNRVTMLGELGASLAHELNQPITGAIASADACLSWLAREPPELERARTATVRVKRDGTRAAEIINRLRAFYKKGAPPHRESVDVREIVDEIVVLLRDAANRRSVTIRTEVPTDLPNILADRVPLQQVFMNLMLNAIEAMQDTGGELALRAQRADDEMLLMSISDTGVGLPSDGADHIFDAFITTKPQGTGMGLAITRSIVEAHGGVLWASPNVERGATFHFTLRADGGPMNKASETIAPFSSAKFLPDLVQDR